MDFERASVCVDGEERRLRPMELRLLAYMAERPEVVLSPAQLLKEVWGYADGVETRTLYATVNRLRLALERDPQNPSHILNVPRLGYRFRGQAPTPAPVAGLPVPPGPLVARGAELRQLGARLTEGRLVVLRGPAGVGKSRLALELAWGVAEPARGLVEAVAPGGAAAWAASGGVVWCPLGEVEDEAGLLAALARALGLGPVPRGPAGAVAAALAAREGLLVLDDADRAVPVLRALLPGWLAGAGPRVLLTARRPLGLPGELPVLLRPLGVPAEGASAASESLELLERGVRTRQPDLALPLDAPWLGALLRDLGGLPLAIEHAAPWLLVMGGEELAAHVAEGAGGLRGPVGVGQSAGRHRSLDDALRWSWPLLGSWQRAALSQLAVFRGPFDLRAARAVLELGASSEAPPAHDVLLGLVEHSWLRVDPRPLGQLFSFYAGAREFVAGEAPVPEGARERHRAFHVAVAAEADPELLYVVGGPAWERLRGRAGELEAAFTGSAGEDRARLALALGRIRLAEGPLEGCVRIVDAALAGAGPRLRIALRTQRAVALRSLARPAEARAELEGALVEAGGEAGSDLDRPELGRLLRARAVLELYHGDPASAEGPLRAAREMFRRLGLPLDAAIAEAEMGTAALLAGRRAEAVAQLEAAVGVLQAAGEGWVYAVYLTNLGVVEFLDERLDSAARHLEEAAALNHRHAAVRFEALALGNLALVEERRGRAGLAHTHLDAAFRLTRHTGDRAEEAALWSSRGLVLLGEGRLGEASAALERAAAQAEAQDIPRLVAEVAARRGRVAVALGEWAQAARCVERAVAVAEVRGLSTELAEARAVGVELALARGEVEEARAELGRLADVDRVDTRLVEAWRARVDGARG